MLNHDKDVSTFLTSLKDIQIENGRAIKSYIVDLFSESADQFSRIPTIIDDGEVDIKLRWDRGDGPVELYIDDAGIVHVAWASDDGNEHEEYSIDDFEDAISQVNSLI